MGRANKTDQVGPKGLAISLRNSALPEVWIPRAELRDQLELLRDLMFLVRFRTRVKNRMHGTLARHNNQVPMADLFGVEARVRLSRLVPELPLHFRDAVHQKQAILDFPEAQIDSAERRLCAIRMVSVEVDLLKTLPCGAARHLASYAGLVARVRSRAGRARLGPGLLSSSSLLAQLEATVH
jgi:transposase